MLEIFVGIFYVHFLCNLRFYRNKESRWVGKHYVLHDAFWSTATCRGSSSSLFFNLQSNLGSSCTARPCNNKGNLGSCTARRQDPDNYRTGYLIMIFISFVQKSVIFVPRGHRQKYAGKDFSYCTSKIDYMMNAIVAISDTSYMKSKFLILTYSFWTIYLQRLSII